MESVSLARLMLIDDLLTPKVGELSAINGVAGARAEQVKLIHIVGQTPRSMQEKHVNIHHSIGLSSDHSVRFSRNKRVA